jgi:hypothetical protein
MFQWLSNHRRKKLMRAPFPSAREEIVQHNLLITVCWMVPLTAHLRCKDRTEYRNWVKICSCEYFRLQHEVKDGR